MQECRGQYGRARAYGITDSSFAEWLCRGEAGRYESSLGMGKALSPTEDCMGWGYARAPSSYSTSTQHPTRFVPVSRSEYKPLRSSMVEP